MQLYMLESQGDPHMQMESPFSALSILPHRFQPLSTPQTQIFFSVQQYYHAFLGSSSLDNRFYFYSLFYFLAALGVRCFVWAFSSFGEQRLLSSCVAQLLIAVASLAV